MLLYIVVTFKQILMLLYIVWWLNIIPYVDCKCYSYVYYIDDVLVLDYADDIIMLDFTGDIRMLDFTNDFLMLDFTNGILMLDFTDVSPLWDHTN